VNLWKQWTRQPQRLWIRRALFQVHLWTGIGLGLYVLVISLTGSLLVYRNELYRAATRDPIVVTPSGPRLTTEQLTEAAIRAYPGFSVDRVFAVKNPNQAVTVSLKRGNDTRERLFDPYSGRDLGNSIEWGIRTMSWLLDLHDNLLSGPTGRLVNGAAAVCLILIAGTGMVIWWPGIQTWRRSLMLHRRVSWARFNWDLHSAMGFWTVGFVLLFAITGTYLSDPDPFQVVLDYFEPPTDGNLGIRVGDSITYWLAYLHFGRFGGRLPGCARGGVCESTLKAVWAAFGLVPAAMFVTGAVMWWNRVLCKFVRGGKRRGKVLEPVGP
jgi:uncharacterized iron-regulated membrane protein